MSFEKALGEAKARPSDANSLEQLASVALAEGEEERALPLLESAAEPSSRLLQWRALLERAMDRHEEALKSFARAAALAPNDQGIAHGLARTALEAGVPAEQHYERALHLSPGDGQVLLGLMAARVASGRGEIAEEELARIVRRSPGWIEGHAFRSRKGV